MVTEMKNAFVRLISRLNMAQEKSIHSGIRSTEITQSETQRKK